MQVFLTLDDKANKELKAMAVQLEAVRRAAAAAEVGLCLNTLAHACT